jgi:hypothetical protein
LLQQNEDGCHSKSHSNPTKQAAVPQKGQQHLFSSYFVIKTKNANWGLAAVAKVILEEQLCLEIN